MNFDQIIDRRGTWSLKWDNPLNAAPKADIIPLWVADMDFAPPDEVLAAIRARAEHSVFGYTSAPREYFEALSSWYESRHGVSIAAEDFLLAPAVMPAIGIAIRELTAPGEGVIITPPVYYPFFDIVRDNGRNLIEAPLKRLGPSAWEFDFEGMEAAIEEASARGVVAKALLISSPHNPGGRVWRPEELARLDALCAERGLYLLCDEIHADLCFKPHRHICLAGAAREPGAWEREPGAEEREPGAKERTLVFSGPNKTFNIAGLHLSHVVCGDRALKARMRKAISANGYSQPNAFSIVAGLAAYRHGGPWLDALLDYLRSNMEFLLGYLGEGLPGAKAAAPEGSYLAWVDCTAPIERLGLADDRELVRRLTEEARVRLSPGSAFGTAGSGFVRINVACPRAILEEGLVRMAAWVERESRSPKGSRA